MFTKDLETKSKARVLIHSYYNHVEFSLVVPPFLSSNSIAKFLKEHLLKYNSVSGDQLTKCIAEIERRWTVNDLPDWELRLSEALGLNVGDIDWHKATISVLRKGKNKTM